MFSGVPPGAGSFFHGTIRVFLLGCVLIIAGVLLLAVGVGIALLIAGAFAILASPYFGYRARAKGFARIVINLNSGWPLWMSARTWDPALLQFVEGLEPVLGSRVTVAIGHKLPRRGAATGDSLQALVDAKLKWQFLVRHELRRLPSEIRPNEKPVNLARGRLGDKWGLLIATDQRLIFMESGAIRHRTAEFPYSKISSVSKGTGAVYGHLSIVVSGATAQIRKIFPHGGASEIADYVGTRINPTAPTTTVSASLPSATAESRLNQLAHLKEKGVITDEEYRKKREKVLAEL